jgi:hypothetical protein
MDDAVMMEVQVLLFLKIRELLNVVILLLLYFRKGHLMTYQITKQQCGTAEIVLASESHIFVICDIVQFISNIKIRRTKVSIEGSYNIHLFYSVIFLHALGE